MLIKHRALAYRPASQFKCVPVYGFWGMVRGEEGYSQGDVVGDGISAWGDWVVCAV